MKNKIKTAREMLNALTEANPQNGESSFLLRLKRATDLAELTYNDVIIKRSRSKSAFQSMKDVEQKLDELLEEAKNIKTHKYE